MSSSFREKYLETLKTFDDWVIVSEWAQRFGELYPDLLDKADREAENQVNDTTGLSQIAARMGSILSTGGFEGKIEVDTSERPRKVKYVHEEERLEHEKQNIEDDIAPLRRDEIIRLANNAMGPLDKYRIAEFETISKQLKLYFGLDFEVDHAIALLNNEIPGEHHPNNFQLILKAHNAKKNNTNWNRFSLEEQTEYIETAIKLQGIVASRFSIDMESEVLGSLIDRLTKVYN